MRFLVIWIRGALAFSATFTKLTGRQMNKFTPKLNNRQAIDYAWRYILPFVTLIIGMLYFKMKESDFNLLFIFVMGVFFIIEGDISSKYDKNWFTRMSSYLGYLLLLLSVILVASKYLELSI